MGPLLVLKPRNPKSRSGSSGLQDRGGRRDGVGIILRSRAGCFGEVVKPSPLCRPLRRWGSGAQLLGWRTLFSAVTVGRGSRNSKATHSGCSWYILRGEVRAPWEAQDGSEGIVLHFLPGACLSAFPECVVSPHVSASIGRNREQMLFFLWISCSYGRECPYPLNMY